MGDAHYVAAGFARIRSGDVQRARVGAAPAMTDVQVLDAKIRELNGDVTAAALDPAVAPFAVGTWVPFFASWEAWETPAVATLQGGPLSAADLAKFSSFVQQYNALLDEWAMMGQRTAAARDPVLDSWPRKAWNEVTSSTASSVAATAVAFATCYLAYDAWESRQRRRRA